MARAVRGVRAQSHSEAVRSGVTKRAMATVSNTAACAVSPARIHEGRGEARLSPCSAARSWRGRRSMIDTGTKIYEATHPYAARVAGAERALEVKDVEVDERRHDHG
jgi:hypothetical protein